MTLPSQGFLLRSTLAIFALSVAPEVARADGFGQALVRGLDSPLKENPLADASGRVPVMVTLAPGQSAASLGMREIAPGVAAARLSPSDVLSFADDHPGVALEAGPPLKTMLDASGSWTGARAFRKATGIDGKGVIVGIVDTGIDITHPSFLTADGHSRIAWLLTWGSPQGLHPDVEDAMGCNDPSQSPCAVYSGADLDAMIAKGALPMDVHDTIGHGTHVAGIAAGNGQNRNGAKEQYVGVAPGATLVVAAPERGGGFPDDAVVRGTQFIMNRADAMGLPAVANLSLGGDYGPHDGTSPLERSLSALVGDDKPGRAIVVAAGNSGALYKVGSVEPAGIRTEVRVDPHAPVRVPVLVPGSTNGQVYVWITYQLGDEVNVGLEGPHGATWISQIPSGDDAGYDDGAGTTASVINNEDNGKTSLNKDTAGAIVAWDGKWAQGSSFAIQLSGRGDASLWVTGTGAVGQSGAYFPHATKAGTIAVPASAPDLLAVGCSVNRLLWTSFDGTPIQVGRELPPDSTCYYSAAGPTPRGVPKPEILAPGGFVVSAMSADTDPRFSQGSIFDGSADCPNGTQCFVVNNDYVVSAGTSMSSPHVAGAVALLFEQSPNLTQAQVTEILQASARHPQGSIPYDSQVGPGSLDLTHALDVMAAEMPLDTAPDVTKSWWFVSDETARPDPTFPVWGTIELRRADGTVASGLDGKKLSILVDGGKIVKTLTKVRHGLFRFAVAGEQGAGGTKMQVRVLYDGAQIGDAKVLEIAADPFIDTAAPKAVGGCAIGAGTSGGGTSGERGAGSAFVVALTLAAGARRRARRS